MPQPIIYKPELWQQRGLLTLLKLIHDAVFDPVINQRIVRDDTMDMDLLLQRYLPNASPQLADALKQANTAANKWVAIYRGSPELSDDQDSRREFTAKMAVVMDYLFTELHSEDFSISW
jgi:hypothetical protein